MKDIVWLAHLPNMQIAWKGSIKTDFALAKGYIASL
jgi:hypothetical protein